MDEVSLAKEETIPHVSEVSCHLLHPLPVGVRRYPTDAHAASGDIDDKQDMVADEPERVHTPTKVPASELTGKNYRATMRTERRNLVNAIKIATYNAERLLARRFFKHYKDPRDWLTFFRSILQLPGTIANRSTDEIVVELRPPDEPKVRHALALTLAELNALGGRTFGDGQRLTFALKS